MRIVSDPAIATKIARMKQRVRWQHPLIKQYGIDQTQLAIVDGSPATPKAGAESLSRHKFSFLVLGDSGTSRHLQDNPQDRVATRLLDHAADCDFILHTGDVVYLSGSSEQYPDNFIKPYREFLVGGEAPETVRFDKMTFKLPFLPVLGNHDYYDLALWTGIVSKVLTPVRRALRRRINLDIGWHGSFQGEGFTKAFIDYLQPLSRDQLAKHLQAHYTHRHTQAGKTALCLSYVPGKFTRLPNRYYSFREDGIDFFALDSNTFNAPQPLPKTPEGQAQREKIEAQRAEIEARVRSLIAESASLSMDLVEQADRAAHIYAKVEQFEEELRDIDKQLSVSDEDADLDVEQLDWLRDRLIASWQDESAKGRVLYFHHPPYVTEKTKWFQAQTLAVRLHLRQVLDAVQAVVKEPSRPLVDLVLSGHAHCFEYLHTQETGHGDRNIPWVVCGGSGFSLRRQRKEGSELEEYGQVVAKCHLFMGRSGHGSKTRRPYTALRVDVRYDEAGEIPQFVLRPLVAERYQGKWRNYEVDPIVLGPEQRQPSALMPQSVTDLLTPVEAS